MCLKLSNITYETNRSTGRTNLDPPLALPLVGLPRKEWQERLSRWEAAMMSGSAMSASAYDNAAARKGRQKKPAEGAEFRGENIKR